MASVDSGEDSVHLSDLSVLARLRLQAGTSGAALGMAVLCALRGSGGERNGASLGRGWKTGTVMAGFKKIRVKVT